MKKIIRNTALLGLLGMGALVTPVSVLAVDDTSPAKTETEAGFKPGGGLKPETPKNGDDDPDPAEEIKYPNIPPTIGGVTMTHVPTISFGADNSISLSEANYKAVTEKITISEGEKREYYSPHFVQVGDISGKSTAWQVTVLQTKAYTQGEGTNASTLNNTRIRIYENSVVSPLMDKAHKVSGINKSAGYAQIPLKGSSDGSEGITVIRVNDGENVSGAIISSAFSNDYKLDTYYDSEKGVATTAGATASRYDGVVLNIPKGEDVQAGTYKGTLEWTFTVAQ